MSNLTSASYTYGRVTVYGVMPQRKTEYLRSRNFQYHNIIISAELTMEYRHLFDAEPYPTYYLKATYTTRPIVTSHNLADICTWNVTNYNITVGQMRALMVDMLPLVAAMKHYTHFQHHDANKLVNAAAAVNACMIRHMATTNAAYKVKQNV